MAIVLSKHIGSPDTFFDMLPLDWQDALKLVWDKVSGTSDIVVLKEEGAILAGGIIFKEMTADMQLFKKEAEELLASNSYYIGYLWVIEARRGENLGSLWLQLIQQQYSNNSFWLTIEEEGLKQFYEKNGFSLFLEKENNTEKEWLLKSK
ncbi:GNAT family N-acetyltransferase [Cellulophaga baltica]|uniref:GNAT family N-acetyltransferase n=1 Tax=Cellulophaga baltica TaxID=76594 RepID=UPI0037CA1543